MHLRESASRRAFARSPSLGNCSGISLITSEGLCNKLPRYIIEPVEAWREAGESRIERRSREGCLRHLLQFDSRSLIMAMKARSQKSRPRTSNLSAALMGERCCGLRRHACTQTHLGLALMRYSRLRSALYGVFR